MGSTSKMPSPLRRAAKSETTFHYVRLSLFELHHGRPNVVVILRFHETAVEPGCSADH
ncbi:hypothetical protein PAXINDRAFT_166704 [Paxillus involutus ATCC 200175]|nr:hypothetical protein PAXINDRAFT_166704 [Paxillus involutus ATCC 200175]